MRASVALVEADNHAAQRTTQQEASSRLLKVLQTQATVGDLFKGLYPERLRDWMRIPLQIVAGSVVVVLGRGGIEVVTINERKVFVGR